MLLVRQAEPAHRNAQKAPIHKMDRNEHDPDRAQTDRPEHVVGREALRFPRTIKVLRDVGRQERVVVLVAPKHGVHDQGGDGEMDGS